MLAFSTDTIDIKILNRTKDAHCNFTSGSIFVYVFVCRVRKVVFNDFGDNCDVKVAIIDRKST